MELKYLFLWAVIPIFMVACGGSSSHSPSLLSASASSSTNSVLSSNSSLSGSVVSFVSSSAVSSFPMTTNSACAGENIFCDDFDGEALDAVKWKRGDFKLAGNTLLPDNINVESYSDNGTHIGVAKITIFGDLHVSAKRRSGLLITKNLYGGGRYEVRMKPLPGPYGASTIANYYDSNDEEPHPSSRQYTAIQFMMPAHIESAQDLPEWTNWKQKINLDRRNNASDGIYTITNSPSVNPFDGNFHVFRWDWYDGINGSLQIAWYIDDIHLLTVQTSIPHHSAPLWVGIWAPSGAAGTLYDWPGFDYNFDTLYLYVDWIRISSI